jgi:hypothetical protein
MNGEAMKELAGKVSSWTAEAEAFQGIIEWCELEPGRFKGMLRGEFVYDVSIAGDPGIAGNNDAWKVYRWNGDATSSSDRAFIGSALTLAGAQSLAMCHQDEIERHARELKAAEAGDVQDQAQAWRIFFDRVSSSGLYGRIRGELGPGARGVDIALAVVDQATKYRSAAPALPEIDSNADVLLIRAATTPLARMAMVIDAANGLGRKVAEVWFETDLAVTGSSQHLCRQLRPRVYRQTDGVWSGPYATCPPDAAAASTPTSQDSGPRTQDCSAAPGRNAAPEPAVSHDARNGVAGRSRH